VKPRVTVIIPTVNRASLFDVLNSVIGQTFQGYEVVIVDDSKEQSVESEEFNVIRTGGLVGVSKARNLGMSCVDTEFTALLDDDDHWKPEYLEKQLMNIDRLEIDFGITGAVVNGQRRPRTSLKPGMDPYELLYGKPHILRSHAYLPTSAYLFKTNILEKVKFDESITDRENLKFVWDCFKNNSKVYQDPQALVTIDYSSKNSLSRINAQQEIQWAQYLKDKNETWSENFLIEPARNFLRIGERESAKLIIQYLNSDEKNLYKTLLKLAAM
jgi:glycosyltransferase involved in cell wall biosynthesis